MACTERCLHQDKSKTTSKSTVFGCSPQITSGIGKIFARVHFKATPFHAQFLMPNKGLGGEDISPVPAVKKVLNSSKMY